MTGTRRRAPPLAILVAGAIVFGFAKNPDVRKIALIASAVGLFWTTYVLLHKPFVL